MLERSQAGTEADKLDLTLLEVEVEGVAAYLAVYNALTMVDHLQTLAGADGKIQKVLKADRWFEVEVLLQVCLPFIADLVRPIEGGSEVQNFGDVVGPRVLVYGYDNSTPISRQRRKPDEVDGLHDVLAVGIYRSDQVLGDLEPPLLAEHMERNPGDDGLLLKWAIASRGGDGWGRRGRRDRCGVLGADLAVRGGEAGGGVVLMGPMGRTKLCQRRWIRGVICRGGDGGRGARRRIWGYESGAEEMPGGRKKKKNAGQ